MGEGGYGMLTGASRIRQDLALALAEPYGNDQYHPTWGSVLSSYIGQPLDAELELLVRSEVVRVLQQYVDGQAADLATDALSGARSRYDYGDVVSQIVSITTIPSFDTVVVAVELKTRAGAMVKIARTVNL
ncbi:hypothetical protein [Kitasatospora viridis]|uniref:hypothetical protein n=1 Tax=Kitasatospora viridis TaxID=281105 RepID=UPI0011A38556|nr:hypothetical protein [Kitasatospora viridis]